MTNQPLGRIEKVDLRQIWQHEANDFTPWLAEHLDLLREALHLDDLSLVEAEGQVGTFAVDIVADSDSGLVVIENQLEQTDHSHLGQLLTYAAGRDARTLIWITPQFRDEHRAALDWLNHWTSEEVEVYGVEVRAIRIGDSMPAPEFRPVAFPNTWSRQAGSGTKRARSHDREQYRAFYQPLVDQARELGLTNKTTATAVRYQRLAQSEAGDGIRYAVRFYSGNRVSATLDIRTPDTERNKQILGRLTEHRDEVEAELGFELNWEKPTRGRSQGVQVLGSGSLDDPEERQNEVRAWMLDMVVALKSALDPRLQQIVADLDAE